MKGVILAGGTGTRLDPLTKIVNKHLLPVGKYPMIYYAVEKMGKAGITDIMMIIGKSSAGHFMNFLGSGNEWGVKLTYKIQEEAGGIAQALALAEDFIDPGEKFVVILGDNLFEDSLDPFVKSFSSQHGGAKVLLKEVDDPRRYGVPTIKDDVITFIEEKPRNPKSNYSVTGIYLYDSAVFDVIKTMKPSARGELEITDVNNVYAVEGTLTYDIFQGWWTDAGTFQSMLAASRKLFEGDGS